MGRKIYGGRSAARQQTLKIPDKPSVSAKTGYGGGSGAGVPPWSLRFRLHQGRRPSPVGRRRTGINPFRPFRCVLPGCPKGSGSPCFWGGAHRGNGRRPANSAGKHGRRFRRLRPDTFPGCPKPEACPAAKGFAGNAAEAKNTDRPPPYPGMCGGDGNQNRKTVRRFEQAGPKGPGYGKGGIRSAA